MYRQVLDSIKQLFSRNNPPIVLIIGLRQVGKSTLATTVCTNKPIVRFNFDLLSDIAEFTNQNRHSLILFAKKYLNSIIIVDEIQKSPEAIGIVKYLYDIYHLKFLLTGSSEIKIRRGIGDSLTGRLKEIKLYPLSLEEINIQEGLKFDRKAEFNNYEYNQRLLFRYLVYGSLPQLQNIKETEYTDYLQDFINSLLSKDVMEISGTRKPAQVFHLVKLLAYQIGQIVNFNELAQETQLSRITVVNFIQIFEQMGLVIKALPLSTNQRESIVKRTKIYFSDLGLRNALINNFSDFQNRLDKGQLLENAVFAGIKRASDYQNKSYELGFFRSEYGSEIDIVKKMGKKEELYEIKIKSRKRKKSNIIYIGIDNAQKYLY